jgi:drug/metabolite transporter superfamily protein YnfA
MSARAVVASCSIVRSPEPVISRIQVRSRRRSRRSRTFCRCSASSALAIRRMVWQFRREARGPPFGLAGAAALLLCGIIRMYQPATFGRPDAFYFGLTVLSPALGWLVDGHPQTPDLVGKRSSSWECNKDPPQLLTGGLLVRIQPEEPLFRAAGAWRGQIGDNLAGKTRPVHGSALRRKAKRSALVDPAHLQTFP